MSLRKEIDGVIIQFKPRADVSQLIDAESLGLYFGNIIFQDFINVGKRLAIEKHSETETFHRMILRYRKDFEDSNVIYSVVDGVKLNGIYPTLDCCFLYGEEELTDYLMEPREELDFTVIAHDVSSPRDIYGAVEKSRKNILRLS